MRRGRISSKLLAQFTRQLATLLEARLQLVRSIEILAQQQANPRLRAPITELLERITGGQSLSEGLAASPHIFSEFYVALVEVGEHSGTLAQTMERLATHLEKIARLQRKVITALTYPAVIVVVAVVAVGFMLVAVIPTFAEMFRDFGGELPAATQLLLDSGNFLKANAIWLCLAGLAFSLSFQRALRYEPFARQADRMLLKLPLIGGLLRRSFLAKFCRTLGTMLASGVTLTTALEVGERVSRNRVFRESVVAMRRRVVQGGSLVPDEGDAEPFGELTRQMIRIAEETGELATMLLRVAQLYEEELDATIDALTSIIEPVIIVFLGLVLGGTLVAMYLQLFELTSVVQ